MNAKNKESLNPKERGDEVATISSQLRLNDGMTGVMRGISATLNTLIGGFQEMQALTGQAIDTSAFDQAQTQLDAVNRELIQMNESGKRAGDSLSDGMARGTRSADAFMRKIVSVGAVLKGLQQVSKITDFADSQTQNTARLNIMLDTGQSDAQLTKDVANYQAQIDQAANRARADTTNFATAVANMGNNAGDAFSGSKQIVGFTEQLQKHFALSGTSAQSAANATIQLQQGLAKGVLRGQDLNSVIEGAPTLIRAIADYMDVPVGQIKTLAEEGKITSGVIVNAMSLAAEETNNKFKSMPMTFEQMGTMVKNSATTAFRPLMSTLTQIANSDAFNRLLGGAERFFSSVANMANWVIGNWDVISPILQIIAIGIAAIVAAMLPLKIATLAQAAAQWVLNVAQMASPTTWIIVGILALIAIIYVVINAINKATGSANSALGTIMGALAAAGAFIINTVVGLLNALIQYVWTILIEPWIRIINWVLNVFNGGFDSFGDAVKNLLGNIISWFLSLGKVVTKIIDAIFGTNWTDGLTSLQSSLTSWGGNEKTKEYISTEAFQIDYRMDYGDAYSKGAAFGNGVSDKISSAFSSDYNAGLGSEHDYLSDIALNTAETAANTSDLNEDLKYMRDLAEMEVVNRFTASTVYVDMGGVTNTINNDVDADGVVRKIVDGIAEEVAAGAEGVHE